jgi:aspartyl-tRNA(Asn)/glutamyl-tRNA(Gln) amidotransferase subunit A
MDDGMTIAAMRRDLRDGTTTARRLVEACLERIAALDGALHAFITVTAERARSDADRADEEWQRGAIRGPLHGVPIALKDLIATRDILTTAGSQVLADYVPDADAEIVQNLERGGAVLIGKTNTHEFAWGVFTPPTRNPWNLERVPGGSSGGSAAAVAAGMIPGAVGSDTGGSIRIPAACCGITGLKPTYGLVSTAGVIELSASLDHVGPLARTAEDCALLLDTLAIGSEGAPFSEDLTAPAPDLVRIVVLGDLWRDGVAADVLARVDEAVAVLAPHAPVVAWPDLKIEHLFDLYATIQGAEASAYHHAMGWYPARADRYTEETRQRIEHTSQIPAIAYLQARRELASIVARWQQWMDDLPADVLLAPTLPITAPPIAATEDPITRKPLREALLRLTFPFDLLGVPALTVPCGFGGDGLPVGLQIIARRGHDHLTLRLGHLFQQRTSWHLMAPPV